MKKVIARYAPRQPRERISFGGRLVLVVELLMVIGIQFGAATMHIS